MIKRHTFLVPPEPENAHQPTPDVSYFWLIHLWHFAVILLVVLGILGFCIRRCCKKRRTKDGKKGKGMDLKSVQLLGGSYKEKVISTILWLAVEHTRVRDGFVVISAWSCFFFLIYFVCSQTHHKTIIISTRKHTFSLNMVHANLASLSFDFQNSNSDHIHLDTPHTNSFFYYILYIDSKSLGCSCCRCLHEFLTLIWHQLEY